MRPETSSALASARIAASSCGVTPEPSTAFSTARSSISAGTASTARPASSIIFLRNGLAEASTMVSGTKASDMASSMSSTPFNAAGRTRWS
jgi:hypothetical protein